MVVLRCIDEAGVVAELRPETIATGFNERSCYHIFAPVDGASLYIDEALAEPIRVEGIPGWRWQPGFYAGQVVAELVGNVGQRLAEYRIDVAPDDSKLGAEVFNDMLDELYAFDPRLLLGTEAAQASIGVAGEVASPLLAYARLRRYGEALLSALREVAALPLTRLKRERALVPYHRVRRLDAASARGLLRRPDTAAFIRGERALADGIIPLFDVVNSTENLDNPANRALTATLLAVRRRCIQVADALQYMAASEEESDTRTPLQPRLARKLEFLGELTEKLAKVSRLDPYASVSRFEITAAGLNAISAHPCYARAYRFAWSALRPGVAGDLRDESLWISPTWEIYERWCFARVACCLRERYGGLEWTMKYPTKRSDCIRLVGAGPSTTIEAWLQRRFRAGDSATDGFRSVSGELHPDVVITFEAGGERGMLVLDAKYRTSRQNVLDAMRSAHLYQDALRWDEARPICSLLLVPRSGGALWLESPAFHETHQVGVHVLGPGATSSSLTDLLKRWLPDDVI
jgi:hypothetical protein